MKKTLLATSLIAVLLSATAIAQDEKRIVENIKLSAGKNLDINFPVGNLEVEITDGDQIEIEIELKPSKGNWDKWFSSGKNLSDIELKKTDRNNKLVLEIDEENINQKWHVKVPKTAALDIDLGVGNVEIDDLANSAEIDVGVGSVDIDTAINDFKEIDLESGVGDTRISGLSGNSSEKRKMVSSTSEYFGSGVYQIEVEVGVGDAKVHH